MVRSPMMIIEYLLCQHVVLQLDVEGSPVLGVHHQEAEVESLLGPPGHPLHVIT